MTNYKKGITVLICTYNGATNLPTTLRHLANQKTNASLSWELLIVNNGSTDNTKEIATRVWEELGAPAALTIVDEFQAGKDKAIDSGFRNSKYSYVIVCDDDNWLCDTYVQHAFTIMSTNPNIGVLGGRGIPVCQSTPPFWFAHYHKYYAVGEQNVISGEIKHYWPEYRFVWGAGSVINIEAINLLQQSGFKRILTIEKVSEIARSEDLELCFAIWLAGYKMWYDKNLVFEHCITRDRLKWSYFMKIARLSILAIHYLRPYQILIFTGSEAAPKRGLWKQYIVYFLKIATYNFKTWKDFKILIRLLFRLHKEDHRYFSKAIKYYQLWSAIRLGKRYDKIFKQVLELQRSIHCKRLQ